MNSDATYQDLLDAATAPGELFEPLAEYAVRCHACAHRCRLAPSARGLCKVRFNAGGTLRVPFGYASGVQSDPIEKKPFYHVLPGCDALTFGMLGCDFHCGYCQNWITSQALRDARAVAPFTRLSARDLVQAARRSGARVVVSSYNEPLITAEWARAVFTEARAAGLLTGFVSNGHATPEVLDYLRPVTDLFKVDLKAMRAETYRELGGRLESVLETLHGLHSRGFWVEIVTLVVPGLNDSDDELRQIADAIAEVSPDIPWHVTAFHGMYRMTGPDDTPPETLIRAARIGTDAGLAFVYAGNLPGGVGSLENTRCPQCAATLVERRGYHIRACRITDAGGCPECGRKIPGVWSHAER